MFPGDDKYASPIGAVFDAGNEAKVTGQIKLRRAGLFDSVVVSIYEDSYFRVDNGKSLHGISEAGKVSLLDCVTGGELGSTHWNDFTIHHGDVSFRYALFGRDHVAADQARIRGMRFKLEGVEKSVFMRAGIGSFGWIHNPHEKILDAISRYRPDYLKGEFVKEQAMVSYFTGSYELLPRTQTVLGTISASRIVNAGRFGTSDRPPYITIDFDDEPTTVEGAWRKMREVRQFFAWIMGYAPAWSDVVVFTSSCNDDGYRIGDNGRPDQGIEAFGPNEWKKMPSSDRHHGTLIDASQDAEHFMKVMGKWLERNRDERRRSANARYFGSLQGMNSRVLEDGIVSAANTFDLLPSTDKPPPVPLCKRLSAILQDARQLVRKVEPASAQRDEVLGGLGRINAGATLRGVVQHRAKIVVEHFGDDELRGLDEVIRQAVFCRNHYTHGPYEASGGRLDFSDIDVVLFLTKTLEFIYAASELLLCGWNPANSLSYASHPLGAYVNGYDRCRSLVGLE